MNKHLLGLSPSLLRKHYLACWASFILHILWFMFWILMFLVLQCSLITNLYWWICLYNELVMYKCLSRVRGLQYLVLPSVFLVSKEYLCHSMQKTLDVRCHISWISVYKESYSKETLSQQFTFFCYSCIIYVAYTFKVSNYAHANCLWGVFCLLALLSEGLELCSLF